MTTPRNFLYRAGDFIDNVRLLSIENETAPLESLTIYLGSNGSLRITFEDMQPLIVAMAERMYDEGRMDMKTAERLQYLAQTVLMDAAEYREVVMMEAGEDF